MYYFAFLHRKRSSRCTSLSVSNLSRHTTDLSQRLRTITNAGFVGKTKRRTGRRKRTLPVTCASFTSVWPTLVNSGTCHKYPTLLQLCSRIYLNYAHSGKVYTAKAKSGAMPVKPPLLSLIQRTRAMSVQPLGFHICTCLVYL